MIPNRKRSNQVRYRASFTASALRKVLFLGLCLFFVGNSWGQSLSFSTSGFVESVNNDGSISNFMTITLTGDTFTGSNGDEMIGAWNDVTGSPVTYTHVHTLTEFNGSLYAGSTGKVVKWNGSGWSDVTGGTATHNSYVNSLIKFNGSLYAGSDGKVIKWDGSAWSDVTGGTATHNGQVRSLIEFN